MPGSGAADVPIAFVIPCLNEERYLKAAAASLGFGECAVPAAEDVYLILVDNGSADGTWSLMHTIARSSRPGAVRLAAEKERGFVPPRRHGVRLVSDLAQELGAQPEHFLVLQADADTIYRPGYAQWMWDRLAGRRGLLLEGALRRSEEFDEAHPEYRELERSVDADLEQAVVDDADDVVVDDKACGYVLADYLAWGGHFREYAPDGSEVHAETTRLFIRAHLAHGVEKLRVNPAQATASRRRIVEDPALHFATHGFPREEAWVRRWHERHPTRWDVDDFARSPDHPDVRDALFYRRAHEIALFELLPLLITCAARPGRRAALRGKQKRLLTLVSEMGLPELAASPGQAICAVLGAIEKEPGAFT